MRWTRRRLLALALLPKRSLNLSEPIGQLSLRLPEVPAEAAHEFVEVVQLAAGTPRSRFNG